jgi:dephospho-CoA kinase
VTRTRVVGLTGGIGSGKSLVARILREQGVPVVDADILARQVVEPGQPALEDIVREFGPGVLLPDGALDRKALGAIVFGDPQKRKLLAAITHPRIAAAAQAALAVHRQAGAPFVVYEAPLLVENRLHLGMDATIVVSVPEEVQLERVMARDGLSLEEAHKRLASQLPLADKLAVATHIIDNAGTVEDTRAQVLKLVETLRQESP